MDVCLFSLSTDIQQILTGNYAAESVEIFIFLSNKIGNQYNLALLFLLTKILIRLSAGFRKLFPEIVFLSIFPKIT